VARSCRLPRCNSSSAIRGNPEARGATPGLDPSDVAARVLTAICEDELYVFTHPQMRAEAEERFAAILAAMDKAAARQRHRRMS
jgi:hypothetical protein